MTSMNLLTENPNYPKPVILKRFFCAKDLPECPGHECVLCGSFTMSSNRYWPKSLVKAFQFETFWEILRAKEALQDDNSKQISV